MKNLADSVLIKRVQENRCSDSLSELIRRNEGSCYKVFNKYSPFFHLYKIDKEEFYKEKDVLIFKCILSYDPTKKTRLNSWITSNARFFILNTFRDNKKVQQEDSLEDILALNQERAEITEDENSSLKDNIDIIKDILLGLKDKRIYDIFDRRYFSCQKFKSWAIIGKEMELCSSAVRELHDKGMKLLKAKFKNRDFINKV